MDLDLVMVMVMVIEVIVAMSMRLINVMMRFSQDGVIRIIMIDVVWGCDYLYMLQTGFNDQLRSPFDRMPGLPKAPTAKQLRTK